MDSPHTRTDYFFYIRHCFDISVSWDGDRPAILVEWVQAVGYDEAGDFTLPKAWTKHLVGSAIPHFVRQTKFMVDRSYESITEAPHWAHAQ